MNFKNVLLTLIMCGLMVFSFASCGDTTTNKPTENNAVSQSAETTEAAVADTTENVADEEGADSQKETSPQATQKTSLTNTTKPTKDKNSDNSDSSPEKNDKNKTNANKEPENNATSNEEYIEINGDDFDFFD